MRWLLTLTEPFLRALRAELAAGPTLLEFPLGVRRDLDCCEFLAPMQSRAGDTPGARLRVAMAPQALRGITHLYWYGFPIPDAPAPRVDLALYPDRGCSAAVLTQGRAWPVEQVRIAGPRVEHWTPAANPADLVGEVSRTGAFSRLSGALGGDQVLVRLQELSTAIIGVSRLGEPLARGRARTGCRSLVLVDDDLVEDHHLDAMEVPTRSFVGQPKVAAVAEHLRLHAPECEVRAIQGSIETPRALRHAARQELVISAPDRGLPRLLASACAVAYHRLHLDVGTGVFREGAGFVAGADIRLFLPGQGCILCGGGVDLSRRRERDWRRERAGSLASLNGFAVSYALFQLERLIAGGIEQSVWTRFVLDAGAQPRVEQRPIRARPGCRLCALAGRGDVAWQGDG